MWTLRDHPRPALLAPALPDAAGAGAAPGTPAQRRLAGAVWALLLLGLVTARLGAAPLFDVDEGAFAEATREMVASGDYGSPTLDGAPRFDKPILVYWLQAASVRAFGENEGALRLPSALCLWGWCLATAGFAGRRWGWRTGTLAGTVLATSAGPLVIGRACTADALLNLLLALTLFDAWRHLETGRRAPLLRAYLWIGLGLLAKGPIALVIPAAASLLYLAVVRAPRRWLRLAFDPWGWLVLLAVAGPWYGYALQRHGMDFVNGFLVKHNLARYTSTLEKHGGSLLYYPLLLPVLLLPWSALLPGAVRALREGGRAAPGCFLLAWAGFVVAFFSFSGTKLPHYVLYGATPLALGLALALERSGPTPRRAVAGGVAVVLLLLVIGPWLLPGVAGLVRDPLYAALLERPGDAGALQLGAGLALLALLAAWARRGPTVAVLTGGAVALALVVGALATPWLAGALQGPVKEAALVARALDAPAVQWGVHVPSFAFYRGAATPRAEPGPGQLAIARVDRLEASDRRLRILHAGRGYALVQVEGAVADGLNPARTSSAAR
jgi:4-amino-4-deoxy-L-arabinose transferase-like glycosyltransferase